MVVPLDHLNCNRLFIVIFASFLRPINTGASEMWIRERVWQKVKKKGKKNTVPKKDCSIQKSGIFAESGFGDSGRSFISVSPENTPSRFWRRCQTWITIFLLFFVFNPEQFRCLQAGSPHSNLLNVFFNMWIRADLKKIFVTES